MNLNLFLNNFFPLLIDQIYKINTRKLFIYFGQNPKPKNKTFLCFSASKFNSIHNSFGFHLRLSSLFCVQTTQKCGHHLSIASFIVVITTGFYDSLPRFLERFCVCEFDPWRSNLCVRFFFDCLWEKNSAKNFMCVWYLYVLRFKAFLCPFYKKIGVDMWNYGNADIKM